MLKGVFCHLRGTTACVRGKRTDRRKATWQRLAAWVPRYLLSSTRRNEVTAGSDAMPRFLPRYTHCLCSAMPALAKSLSVYRATGADCEKGTSILGSWKWEARWFQGCPAVQVQPASLTICTQVHCVHTSLFQRLAIQAGHDLQNLGSRRGGHFF